MYVETARNALFTVFYVFSCNNNNDDNNKYTFPVRGLGVYLDHLVNSVCLFMWPYKFHYGLGLIYLAILRWSRCTPSLRTGNV
jgi:hypothetical protein